MEKGKRSLLYGALSIPFTVMIFTAFMFGVPLAIGAIVLAIRQFIEDKSIYKNKDVSAITGFFLGAIGIALAIYIFKDWR